MNVKYFVVALAVMAGITYLIRLLPLLFVRKKITSVFIRSFLYYVPYTVLSAIAFPAIFLSTGNVITGIIATAVCLFLSYKGRGLITCMFWSIVSVVVIDGIILLL